MREDKRKYKEREKMKTIEDIKARIEHLRVRKRVMTDISKQVVEMQIEELKWILEVE